jgi:phospholipid/cholesterol/gamma-HCH transport system permease protein
MMHAKDIRFTDRGNEVECLLIGDWVMSMDTHNALSKWRQFLTEPSAQAVRLTLQLNGNSKWDSSLLIFIFQIEEEVLAKGGTIELSMLPEKVQNLLQFAKQRKNQGKKKAEFEVAEANWEWAHYWHIMGQVSTFWGKWLLAFFQLMLGRSFMRFGDFLTACRNCGASALPIVTLIAFLTGLTMAFVGSVQLEKFNATIYVADLVSLAMVREMGALMVAIVMAGRTGASFAAELGSMKIREEIDSLRTFGIPAIEFLVLPRTLALFIMTPILTLYADVVGILGGLTVGTQVMEFSSLHYFEQTQSALTNMWEIYSGLMKSLAFGLIIGLVGCYKGLFTGSNSALLGKSVTSSVVVSITMIVICDALFEICFSLLGYR